MNNVCIQEIHTDMRQNNLLFIIALFVSCNWCCGAFGSGQQEKKSSPGRKVGWQERPVILVVFRRKLHMEKCAFYRNYTRVSDMYARFLNIKGRLHFFYEFLLCTTLVFAGGWRGQEVYSDIGTSYASCHF